MLYEFVCDNCEVIEEINATMSEGPPAEMLCSECGQQMRRLFTTQIIFKGSGWITKDLRAKAQGGTVEEIDKFEEKLQENKELQENANEVLSERRKGRKKWKEYQKRFPDRTRRYKEALDKGIKGK